MNGEVTLSNHLLADPNVTALVSTVGGLPAIAIGVLEPTKWGVDDSTISIYNAVGMDNRDKRMIVTLTANCRASTENKVKQLASAVVSSTNRETFPGGRYYCQTGFIIQPQDDNDSYNMPVEITMKAGEVVE